MQKFKNKIWLSSPTMHGEELKFMQKAYDTNWMSTVGENINEIETSVSKIIGVKNAVALSCGTAALHLAVKLARIGSERNLTAARKKAITYARHVVTYLKGRNGNIAHEKIALYRNYLYLLRQLFP